jgi:adenylate cyclase
LCFRRTGLAWVIQNATVRSVSLFSELRRRNVIRVVIAYLASVWLLLQVADLVMSGFDSPAWILKVLLISAALGFPLVVLLSWFYELTPEGVKGATRDDIEPAKFLGRKIDFVIIGLLVVAVVFLVVDNYLPDERTNDNSIAVLPFDDLSVDGDQEFFSRGISEEIINLLTRVEGLRVVARTSSFSANDGESTIPEIAAKLNVDHILEGSVRRDEFMVRITAQLIDAKSDSHIWSQNYDREMSDIFSIQDEVAQSIIDKLPVTIAGEKPKRGRPTDSAKAYEWFLKAKDHLNNFRVEEAMAAADKAIGLDSAFAEAYELRASIYWALAGEYSEAKEAQVKMGIEAGKALEHDPTLVLAQALYKSGNLATYSLFAELDAFEQAAVAEPINPAILEPLIFNLRKAGYLNEALAYSRKLLSVDPYSTRAHGRLQSSLMACSRTADAVTDIGGQIAADLRELVGDIDQGRNRSGAFDADDWFVGEIALLNDLDDVAIERITARLEAENLDASWLPALVAGARDPANGAAYMDERIPEIIATAVREESIISVDSGAESSTRKLWLSRRLNRLYLVFGFLDRFYEIIEGEGIEGEELSSSYWPNSEDLIAAGISLPAAEFTSHPEFLEMAAKLGIVDVWEKRGPPDFCQKVGSSWECGALPKPCPD